MAVSLRMVAGAVLGAMLLATAHCSLEELDAEYGTPSFLVPEGGAPPKQDSGLVEATETLELVVIADPDTKFTIDSTNTAAAGAFSLSLARGTVVDLGPKSSAPLAWRFSGDCTGTTTCAVTMDGPKKVTVRMTAYNYAFVTSEKTNGGFGGAVAGDAICNRLAEASGLPGTYRAWISSPETTARDRLVGSGWIRTDGRAFVKSKEDLASGKLLYPLRLDEKGGDVAKDTAWSDCDAENNTRYAFDCSGWTSSTPSINGSAGAPSGSRPHWSLVVHPNCEQNNRLYCFGNDLTASPMLVPSVTAPRIFVTKGTVAVDAGLAAFDQLCKTEATASGNFSAASVATIRALIGTSTSAASRILRVPSKEKGTGWMRPDGVFVSETSEEFTRKPSFLAPLSVSAAGEYLPGVHVFTGYSPDGILFYNLTDTPKGACGNWATKTGNAGVGSSALSDDRAFKDTQFPCASTPARPIYCIEP